eukprot:1111346-Amphidinium_carterae.1
MEIVCNFSRVKSALLLPEYAWDALGHESLTARTQNPALGRQTRLVSRTRSHIDVTLVLEEGVGGLEHQEFGMNL